MAEAHSTGTWCPSKGQEPDHPLLPLHCVREPGPPPYGRTPPSETTKRLGMTVRLLRVSHGWSQEVLAELAGLDRSFIGAVERAEHNITLTTAEKIARAFDMTVAELLASCGRT